MLNPNSFVTKFTLFFDDILQYKLDDRLLFTDKNIDLVMELLNYIFKDLNKLNNHYVKRIFEYKLPKQTTIIEDSLKLDVDLNGSKKQENSIVFIKSLIENMVDFIFNLRYDNEPLSNDVLYEIMNHLDIIFDDLKLYYRKYDNYTDLIWNQDSFNEAKENIKMEIIRAKFKPSGITDFGNCRQCRSKNLHVVEKQLRSADEPSSFLITCLYCNFHWKIS